MQQLDSAEFSRRVLALAEEINSILQRQETGIALAALLATAAAGIKALQRRPEGTLSSLVALESLIPLAISDIRERCES